MGKRRIITFELRQEKDDDLDKALSDASEHEDRSDVLRKALRAFFGLRGVSGSPHDEKRHSTTTTAFDDELIGMSLEHVEKPDVDVDAGLDSLLEGF